MSQRTSLNSSRSKSPSCHEEGEIGGSKNVSRARFDEMQRQAEELEDSDRYLISGSPNYSRLGSANASPGRPSSRPGSGYENERDPYPVQAPGSRGVSPGVSQRASAKVSIAECSRSRSRAGSPLLGSRGGSGMGARGVECDEVEPPEDQDGPAYLDRATSYSYRGRSTRGPSEVLPGSNLNSVHFVSSGQSAESRGAGKTTSPGSREMMTLGSLAGSASGAGYAPAGIVSGSACAMQRSDFASESVGTGVSFKSRRRLNYNEGSGSEQICRADCRRYLNEVERSTVGAGPSKASVRSPVSGLSENMKQRNLQPLYSQEGRQAEPEHYVHSDKRGNTSAGTRPGHEPFLRDPQMPSTSNMHHRHHHHHHHDRSLQDDTERHDKAISALAHLSQLKKTSSHLMCGVNQNVDFSICSNEKRSKKLPERPCLQQEELAELINCERQDVESASYLVSEERKIYKKPCPKQQQAQMNVSAIVKAHTSQTCGEKYTPLEHPDPEDISPEVAASMMFSQELGIKMDECPRNTILHLFPEEYRQPFPEKIRRKSISIVDPNQNDQEELMEKSARVPSEGVSDSAYTRTMKEKGLSGEELAAQRSFDVDFAIGQSKREYVLVAQKPQRFNKVQFRGGSSPSWFPGYFAAFPNENGLRSVSSPSGVFQKAWFHTNPRNMPTNDVIIID